MLIPLANIPINYIGKKACGLALVDRSRLRLGAAVCSRRREVRAGVRACVHRLFHAAASATTERGKAAAGCGVCTMPAIRSIGRSVDRLSPPSTHPTAAGATMAAPAARQQQRPLLSLPLSLLLLLCCCGARLTAALHADRAGKEDWMRRHVGRVVKAVAAPVREVLCVWYCGWVGGMPGNQSASVSTHALTTPHIIYTTITGGRRRRRRVREGGHRRPRNRRPERAHPVAACLTLTLTPLLDE